MRLFKSKKGLDYAISLMVVVLICIMFLFIQLSKKTGGFTRDIGDMQLGLMQSQQEADNMLLYLDYSAKQSAYTTAYLLASNGGFAAASDSCGGDVQGYLSWNACDNPESICFPDILGSFNKLMQVTLDAHLAAYESQPGAAPFMKDNYIFTLHEGKIIGTAIKDTELSIMPYKPRSGFYFTIGGYSFKPSFSVDFNYTFDKYFELKELAAEAAKCANKFADIAQRNQCVLSKSPASFEGKYVFFNMTQPESLSPYTNQPPEILFSLCVPTTS